MIRHIHAITAIAVFLSFCPAAHRGLAEEARPALRIYAPADFLHAGLLEQFTAETGIPLAMSFASSGEDMLAELTQSNHGRYDLVLSSSSVLQQLIGYGRMAPLDRSALPSLGNLMPRFASGRKGGLLYAVPVCWSLLGITVNRSVVTPNYIDSWNFLWDGSYNGKLLLPADFRTSLGIALLSLGHSVNSSDAAQLAEAMGRLKELAARAAFFTSVDSREHFMNGSVQIGITFNQKWATENDSPYAFIMPQGKSVIITWLLAMPKTVERQQEAFTFVEFMLRPDIAARLSAETGYGTVNKNALKLLPEAVRSNPKIYPPEEVMDRIETEAALPERDMISLEIDWHRFIRFSGKAEAN